MTADLREAIGPGASEVENASLLLDKFVVPKQSTEWQGKLNHASRWSLLRTSRHGHQALASDLAKAKGNYLHSTVLSQIQSTKASIGLLQETRRRHTQTLMALVQKSYGHGACVLEGELKSRMAINLSDGVIENGGICLDRTFGQPFIPGSAVKGITRHAALAELHAAPDADKASLMERFCRVFGYTSDIFEKGGELAAWKHLNPKDMPADLQGAVTFLPAYSVGAAHLEVDITNVHTPVYYTGDNHNKAGDPRSLREENPRPNYFPVVAAGAKFGFCLVLNPVGQQRANSSELLSAARDWLIQALTVYGVGAKTGAGYGWFREVIDCSERIQRELEERQREEAKIAKEKAIKEEAARREQERLEKMDPIERATEEISALDDPTFADFGKELKEKSVEEQTAYLRLLQGTFKSKLKTWRKRKKAAILNPVEEVARTLNVELP